MEFYEKWLEKAGAFSKEKRRPIVNICYAQSLDGSITSSTGSRLVLSGEESSILTHKLRAIHDAILVGIGTVLSDDPCLTVRHVKGTNPQPVIIDSVLKIPRHARLLVENPTPPWIMTTERAPAYRIDELQSLGARIEILPADLSGSVSLPAVLEKLSDLRIRSVMVEGGARIISSFLSEKLVDHLVLTIAMVYIGGFHLSLLQNSLPEIIQIKQPVPRLDRPGYKWYGNDLIIWGDFVYSDIK